MGTATAVVRKGVSREVAQLTRRFVAAIPALTPVEHRLRVIVVPANAVSVNDDGRGFGVFLSGGKVQPRIFVAGYLLSHLRRRGCPTPEARWLFLWVLAHELAHYEQFRDGRQLQEAGVNVRARNLVKKFNLLATPGTPG